MTPEIRAWAARNNVSPQALNELRLLFGMVKLPDVANVGGVSEAAVQARARLDAPQLGEYLWRNNVGVLKDETGRPVRYGLANDSKALNAELKSGDLIGWRKVLITPDMVGYAIAQFVSKECKPVGWHFTGTKREIAQLNWITLILSEGGHAEFTT